MPEEKRPFVIKKGGGYVSICTERFNFLDVKNFIGPGVNYDKFVRTYNAPDVDGKGAWPYEWSKLDIEQFLPPPEAFFSSLRNCNTLGHDAAEIQRNYDGLKAIWIECGWRTMRDMLIHYSSQDVLVRLTANANILPRPQSHRSVQGRYKRPRIGSPPALSLCQVFSVRFIFDARRGPFPIIQTSAGRGTVHNIPQASRGP